MRKIEIELFPFSELSEDTQARAIRDFLSADYEFPWAGEYRQSLREIEDYFDIKVKNWEVSTWRGISYTCDIPQESIRGLKLKSFSPEHMPTGFCADWFFWGEFYKVFKASGDAKRAIDSGLHAFFVGWQKDMEWYESEEFAREELINSESEFTKEGERH